MPIAVEIRKLKTKTFTKLQVRGPCCAVFHTGFATGCAAGSVSSGDGLARDPPHARDFAAGLADARDCLAERLDRDRHVKSVGVNERGADAHDGDVALPENEVAALQSTLPGVRDRRAECLLLHVAVARADTARGGERDLDEARAIEPERGLTAPQIRHAEKALRHGDEIRL